MSLKHVCFEVSWLEKQHFVRFLVIIHTYKTYKRNANSKEKQFRSDVKSSPEFKYIHSLWILYKFSLYPLLPSQSWPAFWYYNLSWLFWYFTYTLTYKWISFISSFFQSICTFLGVSMMFLCQKFMLSYSRVARTY